MYYNYIINLEKLLLFTIWLSTGMGLALILGWFTIRYLLQKSFHHKPVQQTMGPEDFQLPYQEFFLTTQNNKKIQVFFIGEKNTGPLVIAIHGYENTAEKFFPLCGYLIEKNYRLLLFNTRNHGKSDTDGYSTLIQYAEDLETVYDYARKNLATGSKIFLLGHSLGGATVLYKAVHMTDIAGVISIACFSDLHAVLVESFLRKHFPRSVLPVVFKYIEWSLGYRLDDLSPRNNISRIKCPVLLLHGDKDKVVSVQALYQLRDTTTLLPVKSKIIQGADHSSLLDEHEMFKIIHEFISNPA